MVFYSGGLQNWVLPGFFYSRGRILCTWVVNDEDGFSFVCRRGGMSRCLHYERCSKRTDVE